MDRQRLSFPTAAVAIRKAMTLNQQDSRMSVRETQTKDLTTEGSNANAKVLTYKSSCCDKKYRCKKVTTVVCEVWVFSTPARMSAYSRSSESLKL